MIKAAVRGDDGTLRIILGLSDKNAERMAQQRPVVVVGDELGLHGIVIVIGIKDENNNVAIPRGLVEDCRKKGMAILLLTVDPESMKPPGDRFVLADSFDFSNQGFVVVIGRGKTEEAMSAAMHQFISPTTRILGGKLPTISSN